MCKRCVLTRIPAKGKVRSDGPCIIVKKQCCEARNKPEQEGPPILPRRFLFLCGQEATLKRFKLVRVLGRGGEGEKRKFKWFTLDGELINLQRISENFFT